MTELNQNHTTTINETIVPTDTAGHKSSGKTTLHKNPVFSVNDYLRRKMLLYTYTGTGSLALTTQSVVSDYIASPSVANKMKYMSLLRGNFEVTFIMNTNPYAVGQIIACVQYGTLASSSVTSSTAASIFAMTTKDHIILDAGSCNQATLTIPMAIQDAFIQVSGNNTTNSDNLKFSIATLVPFTCTSDGTSCSYSVQVYVSVLDAELTVPVINDANSIYTMEVKETRGKFSYPLSIASSIGTTLKDVPVIGPFAYATGLFLGAASDIAKFFGFSRPMNISDTQYIHEEDYTSYLGPLRVKKLTLDPMQEVTLDASYLGDKVDNLSFNAIILRRGIVTQVAWPNSSTNQTLLYTLPVNPQCIPIIETTTYTVAMPPVTYVSQLFKLWTGTLIFDFEVPANRYVRGKLRFVWTAQPYTTTPTYAEISQNGSGVVMDLTTSTKITIKVPWGQTYAYMPVQMIGGTNTNFCNGIIYIYVEEQLVTLASTFSLTLNIYMRGDKDIDFQIPDQAKINRYYRQPYVTGYTTGTTSELSLTNGGNFATPNVQAGFQSPTIDSMYFNYTMESNLITPVLETEQTVIPDNDRQDAAMIHMGERFYSLRNMLKRFYLYSICSQQPANSWLFYPNLPMERILSYSAGTITIPPVIVTPMRYVMNMFYGYRGSVRYRINFLSGTTYKMSIKKYFSAPFTYYNSGDADYNMTYDLFAAQGEATYTTAFAEPVYVEIPYQGVSQYQYTTIAPYSGKVQGFVMKEITNTNWNLSCAIGEDFNPVIWNGIPVVSVFYL